MQKLKEKKPLLIKLLAIILLAILCCNLPEEILFWKLCKEQDRNIPPNTEVIVSACKRPGAYGVPGGEVLFVREGRTDKMYLLDLRTGEKRDVPNDPLLLDHGIFLSSELVWLEGSSGRPDDPNYRPNYILDLTDGQRYELVDLKWQFPNRLLQNGELNPGLFPYFTGAEQVFIYHSLNQLIALSPDFRQHPERNVIFPQTSFGSADTSAKNGELLVQLMKDLEVDFETVDLSLRYADVASPTGKYTVRSDGIYLSETNMPVVTRDMGYYFRGWYYDESGVVFQEGGPYLINFGPDFGGGYYRISSPILKLRLPTP